MEDKYFTEDLIIDIISRVPTKHVTRFTCVSKSWRSLIHTDPYFFRFQRTASLRRLHRQIRMDILKGWTMEDWRDRSAVWGREMAKEILTMYDHLNVIPEWYQATIEDALYMGYDHLGYATLIGRKETRPIPSRLKCTFTLEDLQSDRHCSLARLAMDQYNEAKNENWVFEEVIYLSRPSRYQGLEFSIHFGARSTRNVLCLFVAEIYNSPDKSQEVESVYTLEEVFIARKTFRIRYRDLGPIKWRKVDVMGSSGDHVKQLDTFIIRQTRKRTYVKQADSSINSYRTTECDKIWSSIEKDRRVDEASSIEKDRRVDEASMGMN